MPFVVKKLKAINTDSLDTLGHSVVDLAKFVEDEFAEVAKGAQDTFPDTVWNIPLPRPRRGTYVYADGTHWNPGSGEGPYWFDGTSYHPMGQGAITDAPNTGLVYGRQSLGWTPLVSPSPIRASLGADVLLNNTVNYFPGPSVAQGTVGTWFVSGQVTLVDTAGAAGMFLRLWDGATIIASGFDSTPGANLMVCVSLSGYITAPAGNLRISVKDGSSVNGRIKANTSGDAMDSTITAFRIA